MDTTEVVVWSIALYVILAIFGLLVGSFLNVVIFRTPKEESVAKGRSHCMTCGYQLAWYDLIPLFSWIALKGRCRKCGEKISVQYPIIEASNAILWVVCFMKMQGLNAFEVFDGFKLETFLYCLMFSALLALSVIDFRTYIIPLGINWFIAVLGVINIIYRVLRYGLKNADILHYAIGAIAVSVPLILVGVIAEKILKKEAMGGGDVRLMAAAGLLIGWKKIVLALFLGCILGSVLHTIRMKVFKVDNVLAFGPYLSLGIFISSLFGDELIMWYVSSFLQK